MGLGLIPLPWLLLWEEEVGCDSTRVVAVGTVVGCQWLVSNNQSNSGDEKVSG